MSEQPKCECPGILSPTYGPHHLEDCPYRLGALVCDLPEPTTQPDRAGEPDAILPTMTIGDPPGAGWTTLEAYWELERKYEARERAYDAMRAALERWRDNHWCHHEAVGSVCNHCQRMCQCVTAGDAALKLAQECP